MISFLGSNTKADYNKLAYDYKFNDLDGSELSLNDFKNKVIVVVNVASQCGFTNQYEDMQKIWDKYQDKGVVMLGVPSNDFGKPAIIFGDGNQKRCFSYIDDCIYCMENMLDNKTVNGQIINIGPDEEFVTINKVAEICQNISGSNLKPIYKKDRPQEVKEATCSADKARKLLNYKTKTDLYTGIKKTYEYIKKRGSRPFDYSKLNLEIVNSLTPEVWINKEI